MSDFQHISVADTAKLLADNKVVIADIRDEGSFAGGHIEGAYHLTNGSLNSFMQQFEFDQPVVVVCYHGNSSQGAAQEFRMKAMAPRTPSLRYSSRRWRATASPRPETPPVMTARVSESCMRRTWYGKAGILRDGGWQASRL